MGEPRTVWLEKEQLFPVAVGKLARVEVLLDIGCGIMPQRYTRPLVQVCVEPFPEYVRVLQDKVHEEIDRRYVILNATWGQALDLPPPRSVDSALLVDVVEHLEKEEALRLLQRTEHVVRRQLALFTPLGFLPQTHPDGKDAWGLNGGAWQEHKSGWQPEDFDSSWTVYAAKVYHESDNMGRRFETPFGAMWAIKDLDAGDRAPRFGAVTLALHQMVGLAAAAARAAARRAGW